MSVSGLVASDIGGSISLVVGGGRGSELVVPVLAALDETLSELVVGGDSKK